MNYEISSFIELTLIDSEKLISSFTLSFESLNSLNSLNSLLYEQPLINDE